jgi:hypothetical protein
MGVSLTRHVSWKDLRGKLVRDAQQVTALQFKAISLARCPYNYVKRYSRLCPSAFLQWMQGRAPFGALRTNSGMHIVKLCLPHQRISSVCRLFALFLHATVARKAVQKHCQIFSDLLFGWANMQRNRFNVWVCTHRRARISTASVSLTQTRPRHFSFLFEMTGTGKLKNHFIYIFIY